MTTEPVMVTTIDGRSVPNDSEAWRLCCEAVYVLGMAPLERAKFLQMVEARRKVEGRKYLDAEVLRLEPHYVLALGTREVRRAYLDRVERLCGPQAREDIERRVVEIWEARRAAQAQAGVAA